MKNSIINNLRINDTVTHPMTFAGSINNAGKYENTGFYGDPYGKFYDVVVHSYVTIV